MQEKSFDAKFHHWQTALAQACYATRAIQAGTSQVQKTEFKLYFIVLYRNAPSQKIRRSAEKFPHVFNAQKGNADPEILRKDEF